MQWPYCGDHPRQRQHAGADNAFYQCSGLIATIPDSVTVIGVIKAFPSGRSGVTGTMVIASQELMRRHSLGAKYLQLPFMVVFHMWVCLHLHGML